MSLAWTEGVPVSCVQPGRRGAQKIRVVAVDSRRLVFMSSVCPILIVQHWDVVFPSSGISSEMKKIGVRVARFDPSDPRSLAQSQFANCHEREDSVFRRPT
jgi:hypothetical protein